MITENGAQWLQALEASKIFMVLGGLSFAMLDEKEREKIALKKFSLIAPV